MKLAMKLAEGEKNPIVAWNNTQAFYLNPLSKAFAELFVVQNFTDFINKLNKNDLSSLKLPSTNDETKEAFNLLYKLYCLSAIEADLGTFRDGDFISWE
jgi:hypothetical protein